MLESTTPSTDLEEGNIILTKLIIVLDLTDYGLVWVNIPQFIIHGIAHVERSEESDVDTEKREGGSTYSSTHWMWSFQLLPS